MHDVYARADVPAIPPPSRAPRTWPLLLLAAPAAVAVWSGWVGIGQMTGFGMVRPLPGIWDSLHVDTAVTLPLGVEAYAAFALRAWLTSSVTVSVRTRRYARRSAIGSLVLGMAGQVAYHLLTQSGTTRAPWGITTLVSCLPVLVLGMGTALAHLLRADADDMAQDRLSNAADRTGPGPAVPRPDQQPQVPDTAAGNVPVAGIPGTDKGGPLDADQQQDSEAGPDASAGTDLRGGPLPRQRGGGTTRPGTGPRLAQAWSAAAELTASGKQVSRRTLREAGLRGSNADLAAIARIVGSRSAS